MKKITALALASLVATSAAGCIGVERKSTLTGPSASGIGALLGNWTSQNIIPSPAACTDFKWTATEQSATSARGNFSATCAGDLKLTGTAQGSIATNGSINWSAQGNAAAPGLSSCAITLAGTAELGIDSISIPYSGDTCLGKVSGTEVLRKS